MTFGHAAHATVRLDSGKLLLTDFTPTPELYDPKGGTWEQTGPMVQPRDYHATTLLPNGKVLVAGGTQRSVDSGPIDQFFVDQVVGTTTSSAELFDPGSRTWMATAPMLEPRVGHNATLLQTGKVGLSDRSLRREPGIETCPDPPRPRVHRRGRHPEDARSVRRDGT